jgi:gamma-glutamyltranspeptidase/glutathione hydrolase
MHDGALAEALVADQAERGGLVTAADLSAYRPVLRDSLPLRAGAWSLRTNPPPAIGGPVLAAMLTLLGPRPAGPWGEDDVAHLIAVQRNVLTARRQRLDPADDRSAAALELLAGVGWSAPGWPSTAHISVVDEAGTSCALTTSHGYGSGATLPGTGLWLNNCLGEHELNRGGPSTPGTRLASNMAPTVGRRDDGAVLAIGSPGADRITTALLQDLASVAYGGASVQEAVDRPRLHVHVLVDDRSVRVEAEEDLPLPALYLSVRRHPRHSMYFGGVGAALRLPDGTVHGAADPRRAGVVLVSD